MIARVTKVVAGIVLLAGATAAHGAVRYAKPNGSSSGSCATWANACTLTRALLQAGTGDQIWVKTGTYGPITLRNGVKVIGGFAGTETQASQSNPTTNQTILDGGNTACVVTGQDNAASTMLRGFTIRNGYNAGHDNGGGGMLLADSSALIVQCVFENNRADWFGAGVSVRGNGSPQFINCIFHDNGTGTGADVHPFGGGAVFLYSGTATFTNCLFYKNKSGDGAVLGNVSGNATFINCTLANNDATINAGGAIFDQMGVVKLRNCILWGNTAVNGGAQIFNRSDVTPTEVLASVVQAGWTGTGNINSDPLFQSPTTGNYKLQQTSPGKNVGNNSFLPADVADLDWDGNTSEPIPKDLGLANRKIEFTVDMGAYETPAGGGIGGPQ